MKRRRRQRSDSLRQRQRRARSNLRAKGCTCAPRLRQLVGEELRRTPAPQGIKPEWAFDVQHQPGCELGEIMLEANAAGRRPWLLVFDRSETECGA